MRFFCLLEILEKSLLPKQSPKNARQGNFNSEEYIRPLLALATLHNVVIKSKRLVPLFQEINTLMAEVENFEPLRQSWIHLPEVLHHFVQQMEQAEKTTYQMWSQQLSKQLGEVEFLNLYHRYVTDPPPLDSLNFSFDLQPENSAEALIWAVDELERYFGSGEMNAVGTIAYMPPEMAKFGVNDKRENNFTNEVKMAISFLKNKEELEELLDTLDDGVYYFLGQFKKIRYSINQLARNSMA